jgi:hypothetical protein
MEGIGDVIEADCERARYYPSLLSYMVNGKRPWRPDLYERYTQLVNTSVNSEGQSVNNVVVDAAFLDIKSGGGEGVRTPDSLRAKQVLSL